MQYIEQTITGMDGTTARFIGYVPPKSCPTAHAPPC